jgi:hypothetical protein
MIKIEPRSERYNLHEHGEHIGYFNVSYSADGRKLSVELFKKSSAFVLAADKNGRVEGRPLEQWISERIVPPTRIGIENLLAQMGLSEYDPLAILKYTSAKHTSDTCTIDFSHRVGE